MQRLNLLVSRNCVSNLTRLASDVKSDKALTKPAPKTLSEKTAVYDQQITHTGQAWDTADYRNIRFEISPKQVNPNFAQRLISEVPSIPSEEHVVHCDGGHPALGHPRVYINLDKPGNHACGYCGQRFHNVHSTKGEDTKKNHIQV
uniref:Zinc finger CHCC-type domain-containing protein n=1 Tax=Acrobeloides nanus TaxID=290746 RepID=A0A914DKX5_9BILA